MSGQYQALVLDYPSALGSKDLIHGLRQVGFSVQRLWLEDVKPGAIPMDQLMLKYKLIAFPSVLPGRVRWLALKIQLGLQWDLKRFAERGGYVLATGAATDAMIALGIFGDGISVHRTPDPEREESWIKLQTDASRCEWLKGLGSIELPSDEDSPVLVTSESSKVEVGVRFDRLGTVCMRRSASDSLLADAYGLCDATGRILATFAEPQLAVTRTPSSLFGSGPGLALFQNVHRAAQGSS